MNSGILASLSASVRQLKVARAVIDMAKRMPNKDKPSQKVKQYRFL